MCFLKSSILSMFLNLFRTVFHTKSPLKQRACVPYLEVLVSGNFNYCLLRRSYRVLFKSKKSFMIGGLKLFIDSYISISKICMLFSWIFDELSFNSRSSKFASSIPCTTRIVSLCILLPKLLIYCLPSCSVLHKSKFFIIGDSQDFQFSFAFYLLVFYCKCNLAVINFLSEKHYLKLAGICYHAINLYQFKTIYVSLVYELLLYNLVSMSIC